MTTPTPEQILFRARTREQVRAAIGDQIDAIVADHDFGIPAAVKRGRNARYPYVPVIRHVGGYRPRTEQLLGLAYATRTDAITAAERAIDRRRAKLAYDLAEPCMRALREQSGLPREVQLMEEESA